MKREQLKELLRLLLPPALQAQTQEIDAAYLAMLNTEIEFKLAVLSEEDAKQAGLNPNELAAIWDFVDFEKPKKEKK